ncbi:hypothetical protein [Mycoavidus sp. SF9855]|uniref:hypothetical protein n=1 Tax=Mycoavidus sp. SF9855 TaxID=2968475 RepID=UPI00211CE523|nr:hypothetical protein [Mycoavidus sp. SF9855]UUM20906.1 hypothetical protein NQD60_05340 [Mycoavidus sp. SF9855]
MRSIFISILLCIFPFIGCGGDNPNHGKQALTLGKNKNAKKSLAELADELSKVNVKDYGHAAHDRAVDLGEIARNLEKIIPEPTGRIASRTLLLMERLINVIHSESSIKNKSYILNDISKEMEELKE